MSNLSADIPQEQLIAGAVGHLEVLFTSPKTTPTKSPASPSSYALICHPHPLYGGTMHNKVVYMIASTFQRLGVGTVRFNFRGVGKSEGKFDHGEGEIEDLYAVVEWLEKKWAPTELWLAGFSYGSYVALRGHRQVGATRLLLIAPSVERFKTKELSLSTLPTLVIQGDRDEIVSPQAVSQWLAAQAHQPQLVIIPEADHFFHRKLPQLRDAILEAWSSNT
jgi:hypothetical protein